jgi:hypothetical protein
MHLWLQSWDWGWLAWMAVWFVLLVTAAYVAGSLGSQVK